MLNILQSTIEIVLCDAILSVMVMVIGYVHSCNLEIGWGSLSGSTILLGLVVCNIFKCTVVAF